MAIRLGTNISALQAERRLGENTAATTRAFERLSSGSRINRASDDAASLSIADRLRADTRVFTQSIRNGNDGLSFLSIAEGAISQLGNIATRVSELAEQSANGVYSTAQRAALNNEAQAMAAEYNRIVATTEFNGMNIFSGEATHLQLGTTGSRDALLEVSVNLATSAAGDGTFQSPLSLQNVNATMLVMGDYNNDGIMDIGYGSDAPDVFGVMLGNGNGSFRAAQQYSTGVNAAWYLEAKAGDLNGDGNLDIVLGADYSDKISVLLGNGDGSFRAATSYGQSGAGVVSAEVEIGDFDSDGILDIMGEDYTNSMVFFKGLGNGTFNAGISIAVPTFDIASGDVNNDGRMDIFISGTDRIALSNGDGTFALGPVFTLSAPRGPWLADINNDGNLDAIAASPGGVINFALGNGDGTFRAQATLTTGSQGFGERNLHVVDLNEDGAQDFLIAEVTGGSFSMFLGNGDGTFKARVSFDTTSENLATGDFNGDGAIDIVSTPGGGSLSLFLANPVYTNTLDGISLTSQSAARQTLDRMESVRESISLGLSNIGALQSRISTAINYNQAAREQYQGAESRLRDADVAQEAASLSRLRILQEASAAVLAQASQQPSLAMLLLRS